MGQRLPICGSVLGLCFGTLFGIVSLDDLQKGEGQVFAFSAMMVGFTIVFLLGKGMDFAVRMYADRVYQDRGGPSPFRVVCTGIAMFMAAEVLLEGLGLREVHRDYLTSLQHQAGTVHELPLLWLPVYLLLGVLVSGPFLWCKLGGAWYRARATALAAASADGQDGPSAATGQIEIAERLISAPIQCRQLRERCEELDRRIGRLKEEHRALEPADAPSEALLEQVRAAETAYRTERDRYDKLLESLIFLRSPRVEWQNGPAGD